jgi:hypothetical protein
MTMANKITTISDGTFTDDRGNKWMLTSPVWSTKTARPFPVVPAPRPLRSEHLLRAGYHYESLVHLFPNNPRSQSNGNSGPDRLRMERRQRSLAGFNPYADTHRRTGSLFGQCAIRTVSTARIRVLRISARAGLNFVQCLPHPIKSPEIH